MRGLGVEGEEVYHRVERVEQEVCIKVKVGRP
jgi:hypothetical protein